TPLDAPPGPSAAFSLPANHTGAFQAVDWPTEQNCYAHIGALALARQDLGRLTIGTVSSGVLDTGVSILPRGPAAISFADQNPSAGWGVTSTLGYLFGDGA